MKNKKWGAYSLLSEIINDRVEHRIGNYELGYLDKNGNFAKKYVGRSDTDLNRRLKKHIGKYPYFKYSYAESALEAYEIEVEDYNEHWPHLDNKIFPDRPDGCSIWERGGCTRVRRY